MRSPAPLTSARGALATSGELSAHVRETHSGVVILLGEFAYKLKKAVNLDFLDFRTVAARNHACTRELELNRRLAPDVYCGLGSFSHPDRADAEPVIVMRRMPEHRRLSRLVERGCDVDDDLRRLARLMARFHSTARRSAVIAAEGGQAALRRRWLANLNESERYVGDVLDRDLWDRVRTLSLRYLDGRGPLFADRVANGHIVDGHGDLIAEDVFCLPDGPRVLDCLEFDDRLRYVDVLDDVAFLAMDLEYLGAPGAAARFLKWYAQFSAAPVIQSLQHHYIAYRAFVRAKVACIRAAQEPGAAAGTPDAFAQLAARHLRAAAVRLVLVGGAPGTGKSTVAAALADRLGGVLLSSDRVRRELPIAPVDRYSPAGKEATYTALLTRARGALEHGESVIADATWGDDTVRRAAAQVAASTASTLTALECRVPVDVAAARAQRRLEQAADPSEAGASVARLLTAQRQPWPAAIGVDTGGSAEAAIAAAIKALDAASSLSRA